MRSRRLPALVEPSPLLPFPLPLEFVAGGDGRPDLEGVDGPGEPSGLGGSGKLGRSGGVELEVEPSDPMKIADKGRWLRVIEGRGVIGRWRGSSRRVTAVFESNEGEVTAVNGEKRDF